ncbi:hypothetical protein M378DRAFT_172024 [Amanita muscaria Koide BX008]|uniref:Uncharacterized protein n=1 Tax=Amanita muscaria (strain Koide BX008) TaxID=946122 RepID=A0A0C2WLY4_AMAMK|nr:hypothetical protein M378DRAFT_172024 [Amanita muscaria Koide BX008]
MTGRQPTGKQLVRHPSCSCYLDSELGFLTGRVRCHQRNRDGVFNLDNAIGQFDMHDG